MPSGVHNTAHIIHRATRQACYTRVLHHRLPTWAPCYISDRNSSCFLTSRVASQLSLLHFISQSSCFVTSRVASQLSRTCRFYEEPRKDLSAANVTITQHATQSLPFPHRTLTATGIYKSSLIPMKCTCICLSISTLRYNPNIAHNMNPNSSTQTPKSLSAKPASGSTRQAA
jgi:hypothetical protein